MLPSEAWHSTYRELRPALRVLEHGDDKVKLEQVSVKAWMDEHKRVFQINRQKKLERQKKNNG